MGTMEESTKANKIFCPSFRLLNHTRALDLYLFFIGPSCYQLVRTSIELTYIYILILYCTKGIPLNLFIFVILSHSTAVLYFFFHPDCHLTDSAVIPAGIRNVSSMRILSKPTDSSFIFSFNLFSSFLCFYSTVGQTTNNIFLHEYKNQDDR